MPDTQPDIHVVPTPPPVAPMATPTSSPPETVVDQVIDLANTVISELRLSGQLNGQTTAALQTNTATHNDIKAILVKLLNAQIEANQLAQDKHWWSKLLVDSVKVACEHIRSGLSSHVATGFLGALGMFVIAWLYAHFNLTPPPSSNNNEPPVHHEPAHPSSDVVPVDPPR